MAKHARLNVGGEEFDVRVEYLCRYPGSRLSELVAVRRSTEGSSEEESKSPVAEEHFIDRDPALFPVVLGALRDRTVRKRPEGHLWIDVKAELEFYHLPWSTLLPEGAHAAMPHEELAVDFVDSTLIKRLRNLPAGACGVAVALRYLADLRAIVLIDEQVSPSNVNQVGRPVGPPQPWYEQLDLYHDATSDATNCKLEFKNDDVAGFPYFPPLSAAGRICSLYPMHLRAVEIQLLRHGFHAMALDNDLEQGSHLALPTNRSAFAQGQSLEVFANIGWAKGWYVDTRSFQRTFRNCSWMQIHF